MKAFDDTITLPSVFGDVTVTYEKESKGLPGFQTIESHYEARLAGKHHYSGIGVGSSRELAIKALMVDIASDYGYKLLAVHNANELTANIPEIKERIAAVIADGRALWLDSEGNKLEGRKFRDDEIAVKFDLNEEVTRQRCFEICEKFDIKRMMISDWRYYHPVNGVELDQNFLDEYCQEGGYITEKTEYIYFANTDTLQKWVEGNPVFEDAAGIVCTDLNALADCLM